MGLFDFLGGGSDYDSPYNEGKLKQQSDSSRGQFSDVLNNIVSQAKQIQEEPRLTASDLFGEQMQRIFDSTRSGANATKQALSRAMMGGGGDVSGSAGARMLGVDQATNEQIGETGLKFSRLANQINRQQESRGDQLISQGLQGIQNLFSMDENMLQQELMRRIQSETASKQRGAGLLGGLINAGGTIGAAAICWVAAELYGEDSEKFGVVRAFLLQHEGENNALGEFVEEYKEKGQEWARQVRDNENLRRNVEMAFDKIYEHAKFA